MTISSPAFTEPRGHRRPASGSSRGRTADLAGRFDDAVSDAKVVAARYTALFVFERLGLAPPNIHGVRSGAILVARVADEAIEQRVLDAADVASLRDAPVGEALDRLVMLLTRELARLDEI
jgi:hypothetical protein